MSGLSVSFECLYECCLVSVEVVARAGYAATILALVVLAINLLVRRRLTSAQMGLLWGLVLLRLAMPAAPGSPSSIHNVIGALTSPSVATTTAATAPVVWQLQTAPPQESTDLVDAYAATDPPTPAPISTLLLELFVIGVPLLWLGGALVVLGCTLFVQWQFARRVARCAPHEQERLTALWSACRMELQVRREIPLVDCDEVSEPAVMGVRRPQLLLPSHCQELTDEQLRLIMLHELMHIKRHDVAANWLLVFVRAVHWWNPIYWLAHTRFVSLREQARDAMVLQHLSGDSRAAGSYADLLLSLATRGHRRRWRVMLPASLLGFLPGASGRHTLARRLKAISQATRRQPGWHRCGVAAGLLLIVVGGLTDAAGENGDADTPQYSDRWRLVTNDRLAWNQELPVPRSHEILDEPDTDDWSEREYDLTPAFRRLTSDAADRTDMPLRTLKATLQLLAAPSAATGEVQLASAETITERATPYARLRQQNGECIVHFYGPPAAHRRIQQAVRAWNRSGLGQVTIETRIVTSRINILEQAGLSPDRILSSPFLQAGTNAAGNGRERPATAEGNAPLVRTVASVQEHVPMMLAVLSADEVRLLLEQTFRDLRSNALYAPKVTLFNGMEGELFSGAIRPYVTGLSRDRDGTVQPQIDTVHDGFRLNLAAELCEDQAVDLRADLDLNEITDVKTYSTTMQNREVTVQVPRVRNLHLNTTIRLQNGQTLLVGIPPTYEQTHYGWVMLTPQLIADDLARAEK